MSIRRKSRFGAALGFAGALFLAALSSCVGPDLEPPFSGAKDSAAPAAPVGTPATSGAAGSTGLISATAGRSSSAEGATPQVGASGGATAATAGAAGKGGGTPTPDAGVADDDAGTAP